jgi:hypothetical protein
VIKRDLALFANEYAPVAPSWKRGQKILWRSQFDIDVQVLFEFGDRLKNA